MASSIAPELQVLLDIEAIKQLKARYCKYADSGKNADDFANLFTGDAVLDEGPDGVFSGRAAIRQMYIDLWPYFKLNQHLVLNPIIEVDGDRASGEWRLFQTLTTIHPDGDRAFWAVGQYDENYLRVNGDWRFDHVKVVTHFCCDYDEGWAKSPFGQLLPAAAMEALGLA